MSDRAEEITNSLCRSYEAFSRGDFDAAMKIAHPEVEFFLPGGQSSLSGADAVRAWMEPDALEDQRVELLELRINDNKVLARQNMRARGPGSGIELDVDSLVVWSFEDDGLVTRVEAFLIHEENEALEAAGLSE